MAYVRRIPMTKGLFPKGSSPFVGGLNHIASPQCGFFDSGAHVRARRKWRQGSAVSVAAARGEGREGREGEQR